MALVHEYASACQRACQLPRAMYDLLRAGSAPNICGCMTHRHKEHRKSPWCAGNTNMIGNEHVLRVAFVAAERMAPETNQRLLGRLLVGWCLWYRARGPRPGVIQLDGTWWAVLMSHGDELGLPLEPPELMRPTLDALRKHAKSSASSPQSGALDEGIVVRSITVLLQQLATYDTLMTEERERKAEIARVEAETAAMLAQERQAREAAIEQERQARETLTARVDEIELTVDAHQGTLTTVLDDLLEEPPLSPPASMPAARKPSGRLPLCTLQMPQSRSQPPGTSAAPVCVYDETERRSLPSRTPRPRVPQSPPMAPQSVASTTPQPSAAPAPAQPAATPPQPDVAVPDLQDWNYVLGIIPFLGAKLLEAVADGVMEAVQSAVAAVTTGLGAWLLEPSFLALIFHFVMFLACCTIVNVIICSTSSVEAMD